MTPELHKNLQLRFIPFEPSQVDALFIYLKKLSHESKKRFGPHPFTKQAIINSYNDKNNRLYLAIAEDDEIVAYTIVKLGWVDFDTQRLLSYGLFPELSDCTLAPSVADDWQSKGVGGVFFEYIVDHIKSIEQTKRIILWGGVQSTNEKAIGFYKKFGFKKLGGFEHNGNNFDMMLEL